MKPFRLLFLIFLALIACNQKGSNKSSPGNKREIIQEEKSILSIKAACILSEIVYCPDPEKELKQYLPQWKLVWNPAPVGGNYAFVASDGTNYAIAVRGSLIEFSWAAFENWIYNDLNVAKQKDWIYTGNGYIAKISQGAYKGWENMNKMIDSTSGKTLWSFLDSAINNNASVVLTGHSLGGNLATVYGSYLVWKWKDSGKPINKINVITFAAPAAGNNNFVNDFNSEFPNSVRVENTNDIVPKFPVPGKVSDLGNLFSPLPSALNIMVGYKNLTVSLNKVFVMVSAALRLLEITSGISTYTQTNGGGNLITVKLSGKNTSNDATAWFAEAGYQHGVTQYAAAVGAPVINCNAH